ncbi:HNH endonuclease signature motif containing protein [Pseudovibrio sp. Tun.PSC04-5.I4]|uniref:HNH endonuclease n=1 Tax=Pseudovibrio sp. Tun.PSC04-5.I4 TaxID=1798213 RepID=UPI00087F5A7C|nr:HNH endonuclease signature motif containing protein [Pseudovibrio sp. Tun.PSC04-5.I4]SDR20058.1 HNH endonuclease [Pseudovibrio sp. Tun.PSC04-5.I4]
MALKMVSSRLGRAQPTLQSPTKTVDPFYLTKAWRALARDMKQLRGYRCEACGADFSRRQDKLIADHMVERRDGGSDLDPANIQCLCIGCHNRKTAKARRNRSYP